MRHINHLVATTLIMLLSACGGGGGGGGGSDGAVTYTVGGSVSGLSGAVVLENNGSNSLTLDTDGAFTFSSALSDGAGYNVSVATQPTGQQCLVTGGSGIISGSMVTDVGVTCQCSDGTDSCYATPPGGDPGGTAAAQYSFTVSVGESTSPGTRAVTVRVSSSTDFSLTNLYKLCVDGLNLDADGKLQLPSNSLCLSNPGFTMVGQDYVWTGNVPYGTYAVSLSEIYLALNQIHTRTLSDDYQLVEVRGPAVRTTYSAALPTTYREDYELANYLSDTDMTVMWNAYAESSDNKYGYHLNRATNQVTNFMFVLPTYLSRLKPYKGRVYGVHWPYRSSNVNIQRYDIATRTLSDVSFNLIPECTYYETEGGVWPVRVGNELRGIYFCKSQYSSTYYDHYTVAWRFDLDTESVLSQQILYTTRNTDSTDSGAGGISAPLSDWIGENNITGYYWIVPDAGLFDLHTMAYDGCYDPARNSVFSTIDPDSGATRCVINETVSGPPDNKLCVESPLMDGSCDDTIHGMEYGARAGIISQGGITWLNDGSFFANGVIYRHIYASSPILNQYRYVPETSNSIVLSNMAYDPTASYLNTYSKYDPLWRGVGAGKWGWYYTSSKRGDSGEILTIYKDVASKSYVGISHVEADVLPPGVIPTGEVDAGNNRYFTVSDPNYSVRKNCAVLTGGSNIADCGSIYSSSRFLLHQQKQTSGEEGGAVLSLRGPSAYDKGDRELGVANSSFGSKTFDPAKLILGVWTLQGLSSGTVTISFNADGTGVSDINVPGYLVEKRAYTYAVSGTNITFHYVSEPTPEPNSTIVSINATDLTLKHPVTGTGYYKKL